MAVFDDFDFILGYFWFIYSVFCLIFIAEMATTYLYAIVHYIFPKDCFEELLVNFNFFHVKVPQITKILRAQSGTGVSPFAQSLELLATTATFAYSYSNQYPFSSYGEAVFLSAQTLIVALLVLYFAGKAVQSIWFLIGYALYVVLLVGNFLPTPIRSPLLELLQASNIPMILVARVWVLVLNYVTPFENVKFLQVWENHRNKSTGQLSVITVFLMFAGSVARIFTSVQETGDNLVVATYVVASCMNGIILAQILFYRDQFPEKKLL